MNPKSGDAHPSNEGILAEEDAFLVDCIVRDADESAFSKLYDRHAPLLYGLACRMLGRKSEAEEILQEAMLQFWNKAADYDAKKGSLRAWLVVLTRSRCLDRMRRRSVVQRNEVQMPENVLEPVDDALMAPEEMEQAEARVAVQNALNALPAAQRKVLESAYFEGMSQSEISARTGEPLGTVKTRMRLGMIKLMELLKPYTER
jgi:RNA polymerase sigma-70 factor (ECF subfamily)